MSLQKLSSSNSNFGQISSNPSPSLGLSGDLPTLYISNLSLALFSFSDLRDVIIKSPGLKNTVLYFS